MEPFRIDFAMNRGHEMLLDREGGISRNELDDIELHMLQSQRIPFVLPMDWFELDGQVAFRYKLDGFKMLRHRLQLQPLKMQQFYALLLGVADALDECRNYMLRPEAFLLDEQFVFSGEQLHDIRLAYVPMKEQAPPAASDVNGMLMLIVRLTAYVEELDGDGLKRILQHADAAKWSLPEFRTLLLELIGGAGGVCGQEQTQKGNQAAPLPPSQEPLQSYDARWPGQADISRPSGGEPSSAANDPYFGQSSFESAPSYTGWLSPRKALKDAALAEADDLYAADVDYDEDSYERNNANHSRQKWLFIAVFAIAVACVWRLVYFDARSAPSLLISGGITLLLTAGLLLAFRKRAEQPDVWGDGEEEWDEEEDDASFMGSAAGLRSQSAAPQPDFPAFAASPAAVRVVEPTALLGSKQASGPVSKPRIWLQRSWEGKQTRIDLKEGNFRIGRTGEQLDYVEEAAKVSRLHLEIACNEGERLAKDVGSSNGSLLNGQTMIAYKAYKLAIGDVIHLAGSDGPAYELKSG